jgi:hypothetical protein
MLARPLAHHPEIMKFLKPCLFLGLAAILAIWISSPRAKTLIPDIPHPYAADLLTHIRAAAKAAPALWRSA